MTNRPDFQVDEGNPQTHAIAHFKPNKGYDSYCNPMDYKGLDGGGGDTKNNSGLKDEEEVAMHKKISEKQIKELQSNMSKRDHQVLDAIRRCRYLTTWQVKRLHFVDSVTPTAGLRAANRCLRRLKGLGLIGTLKRRIGGVRAGSGSYVWYLEAAGERFICLTDNTVKPRKRCFEPSPRFLSHTLAVAECFVQMNEICREDELKLMTVELEPECWREYSVAGKIVTLKPDLSAVTVCGNYEDRWFFEMDLNTEAPIKVIEKCQRYHQYYRCGLEQKQYGVFPLTAWIVPDESRKDTLISHIKAEFSSQVNIFVVITPDELPILIRQYLDGKALC